MYDVYGKACFSKKKKKKKKFLKVIHDVSKTVSNHNVI